MMTNVAPQQSPVYPPMRRFIHRNRKKSIGALRVINDSNTATYGIAPLLYTSLFLAPSALRAYGRKYTIIELTSLLVTSMPMMLTATVHAGIIAASDDSIVHKRR